MRTQRRTVLMQKHTRIVVALTAILLLSSPVTAAPKEFGRDTVTAASREFERDRPIKRIVRVIKKLLVGTHGDMMSPPTP
jgi:hypothetical protein